MKFVKIVLALLGLAVVFKFSMDNPIPVVVTLHEYVTPKIPLFLLLITTFVLGMIAASFGATIQIFQLKRQIKNLQPGSAVENQKKSKGKTSPTATAEAEVAPQRSGAAGEVEAVPVATTPASCAAVEDIQPSPAPAAMSSAEPESEPATTVIELPYDTVSSEAAKK